MQERFLFFQYIFALVADNGIMDRDHVFGKVCAIFVVFLPLFLFLIFLFATKMVGEVEA